MKKSIFFLISIMLISLIVVGCANDVKENPVSQDPVNIELEENQDELDEDDPGYEEIDLEAVKPNEAGEIMVLMYHHIREPEAEWARTPDNFRRDLQTLYDEGYRPISLNDYAKGNITTAAGFTPVVFTFDDGNLNNFNMVESESGEWVIDPDSAVGILVDFHEKHPEFPLEATFYINGGTPFGQKEFIDFKLNYIVDMGMDIGNHTSGHIDFTNASAEKIQEEIGKLNIFIKKYLPDYEVNTLALPFGSKPKDERLRQYLIEGEYQGEKYSNIAILEVGWDPYHSPFNPKFDFTRIRRVRASETNVGGVGMYDWLRVLDKGTRLRFISDGNPNNITVPEEYKDRINEEITEKQIVIY